MNLINLAKFLESKPQRDFDTDAQHKFMVSHPNYLMRWGFHKPMLFAGRAYTFKVNGQSHRGTVALILNGEDQFDIYLLKGNLTEKRAVKGVQIDSLMRTIDALINK